MVLLSAALLIGLYPAGAQEQERKLLDRLLRPDMSLQNAAQNKQFTASGSANIAKQARTKSFYVAARPLEKTLDEMRKYHVPTFDLRKRRYQTEQAKLTTRTLIAKVDTPFATSSYGGVKTATGTNKVVETPEFSDSRPFLVKGKSQKALSAQHPPMTIDQVRELLNKNK